MVTIFKIEKDDKTIDYSYEQDRTILDLKEEIIKDFKVSSPYIDINFTIERPIRVLGKFNLEPGVLARTLDMYQLDRFGIKGRTVTATFNGIDNYVQEGRNPKNKGKGVVLRESVPFDIKSMDDFPQLS
tara:strand:+ start:27 stop:413 length:387 start_codon:yes stop_codon:yes gene_type:complete